MKNIILHDGSKLSTTRSNANIDALRTRDDHIMVKKICKKINKFIDSNDNQALHVW